MSAYNSNPIQIRILTQICAEILINHIFQTITQKITNNISMESLEHVESKSALIFLRFSTQFESIFKLSQTLLLTCLIHIF
jgi:hypothetical protein